MPEMLGVMAQTFLLTPFYVLYYFVPAPYATKAIGMLVWVLPVIFAVFLFVQLYRHGWQAIGRKRVIATFILCGLFAISLPSKYFVATYLQDGAQVQHVEPLNRATAMIKSVQDGLEIKECEYEIVGWTSGNHLVFRKWCEGHFPLTGSANFVSGQPQATLAYDPNLSKITSFESSLEDLVKDLSPLNKCTLPTWIDGSMGMFQWDSKYPIKNSRSAYYSADGVWVALTRQHIYGPTDLLVFRCL